MIIKKFEQQVKSHPDKLAIKTRTRAITYDALNQLSNKIADKIKTICQERCHIGILLDDAPEMIAALLGVLKTGNIYVPLVAEFPVKRLHYIIQHAEIRIFITDRNNHPRAAAAAHDNRDKKITWLLIENLKNQRETSGNTWEDTRNQNESADAYILYTSGSTGFPKGVRQTRDNILYFVQQYTENLELTPGDRLTLFSSFSHDASVMDIYAALLNGATLFPLNLKEQNVFAGLIQWLKAERITVWHSVPTVFRYFIANLTGKVDLPALRYVILGGEAVLRSDIEKFCSHFPFESQLYNLYGQTESTYNSGQFFPNRLPVEDITLGDVNKNTELVVVDDSGNETEPLEVGEIIIVSPHVSPGYWKDDKSSREKFSETSPGEDDMVYFTGDLGRRLLDNKIEFLGRKDHQVKIRGHRIELGEIEQTIMQYDDITQVVVIPVESPSPGSAEIFLAGYFSADKDIDIQSLRSFLSLRLSDYMVPTYLRELAQLPMTVSGKIDRKALPLPDLTLNKSYQPPRNETEEKLVEIWAELLGIGPEVIGINNSFFELGGHSLKATLLTARIFKEIKVNVPLAKVFERQTIKGLSEYIRQSSQSGYEGIKPVEKREYYPLSSAQKRLYFLHQLEGIGTSYNLPFLFRLKKPLTREQLEYTCHRLLERHEILRTCFEMKDQETVQRVYDAGEVNFAVDYYEASPENEEETLRSFIRAFDLAKAPLMRIGFLKTGNRYTFLGDFHHIIADGISLNIVEADFLALYDEKPLPALKVHYKDYTRWQHSELQQSRLKKQKDYWRQTFKGQIPVLALPYDYPRPSVHGFAGTTVSFILKEKETLRLKEVTGELGVTLYMLLLAAFDVLLRELSNQEDIIVGTPIAGRNHADLQNLVGMFVNMLLIRNFPTDTKKFTDFLKEVKQQTLNAYENQEFPFDHLVESLAVPRDTSRNPLFDVTFNLLDERNYQYEISEDNEQTGLIYLKGTSRFDLSLMVIDRGHGLVFRFEYSTRLFKPETMERFLRYFNNILNVIAVDPGVKLSDIEILPEGEKEKILEMCNGIEVPYDTSLSVDRLFEEQAKQAPDHIALVGVHETHKKHEKKSNMSYLTYMSYKELNKKSNQLAGHLIEKGVGPDTIFAIMMERSIELIVGILGILKTGAAYLPIDPVYPQDRIDFMLKDSDAKILLTNREIANLSSPFHLHLSPAPVTSLAYIIYTSGTTGQPKGVAVDHLSLINLCHWHNHYYEVTREDHATQYASFCFDASVWEIFPYLAAGATLHLIEDRIKTDIYQVDSYFHRHGITISFLPTPAAEQLMLLPDSKSKRLLRALLTGGDQLRTFVPQPYPVYNNYGPTENTVVTTSWPVKNNEENIPIGKPIYNNQVFILKSNSSTLQPIGVPGELCIAGHNLARGYLNNPELTAERFGLRRPGGRRMAHGALRSAPCALRASPRKNFLLKGTGKGIYRSYGSYKSYIYRSGDLARWLPNGNIQFMGRVDQQVKIRGFRVEPAEIEKHLNNHPQINESVVITIEKNREKYLCAYVVTNKNLETSGLKDFLFKRLPGFMVPGFFVQLEKIPLTPNGKIDRKALPAPSLETGNRYTPPRNEIERKLVEIWSEILQLHSSPGIDDNFFDLGGHSLKATVMAAGIHHQLDVKIPLAVLFKQPSIRALSGFIKRMEQDRFFGIEAVEEREYYPLSPAQKRLYILQQMDPGNVVYNMPVTLLLEGNPNVSFIGRAFWRLILGHESLRTSFHIIDDRPVQRVRKETKFEIVCSELTRTQVEAKVKDGRSSVNNPQQAVSMIKKFIRPFDLSQPPLLRVGIIKLEKNKHILMVDMHHIVSDGISMNILIKEFMIYYSGNEPEPSGQRIQYKDYSQWINRQRENGYFKKQEAYWLREFSDEISSFDLPMDYPRPGIYLFEGSRASFELPRQQTRRLRQLIKEQDNTLFIALMALFNVFLAKLSGQEDIVVGSPIAGRPHSQLQDIIGMFVNTLALRNYPSPGKTFRGFLAEIKRKSLEAFENQDYPFEELVEKVVLTRDTGRNPLFDVMLVVRNLEKQEPEIPGLAMQPYPFEIEISKFDMTWTVMETEEEDRLDFTIVYCTRLYKPGTIKRFWGYFRQVVEAVLQNPGILLADIEIISPTEKQEILYGFNHENARIGFPTGKSIHQLFAEQSERTPDRIALKGEEEEWKGRRVEGKKEEVPFGRIFDACGGGHLTYKELNHQSSQLAHRLKAKGIQPDTIVAIMVEPSIEMIIGILSILKAGGAYMPIDPDYPQERVRYMLKDSDAKILLTSQEISNLSSSHPHLSPAPATSLAYIIYTSGTTGRPKGSLIDHRNVVRLMTNDRFQFDFTDNDVWTLFHSYCFDFSVWEMYGALLYGGKLVIIPRMTAKDTVGFLQVLKQEKVTVLNQTPSAFYQLMTQESKAENKELNLKYVIFGGEALNPAKLKAWNQRYPGTRLINMYGITETTVHVTYKEIQEQDMESPASCIGLPIPTLNAYIMDRHFKLQPLGVPGELWVGGQGVSRGYLNRPELTAEKFDQDLWDLQDYQDNRKKIPGSNNYRSYGSYKSYIYRTGDLVRWLPDGDIEYLGRIDHQVKIRGYRIELGEIENLLLKQKDVKDAVVIAKEDQKGDRYLCGYIVLEESCTPDSPHSSQSTKLREYLSAQLPAYMIPSFFVYLEEIPLTANGKIHHQALPDPVFQKGEFYRAPGNNIEKKLVEIWKDIFMPDQSSASIGIDDNFFELGGHSLNAIGVVNAVHKAFDVQINIKDIFIAPTIGELASIISQRETFHFTGITPLPRREYYELSYAQARLWVLHKRDPGSPAFNMPERVTFQEKIEEDIIRDVVAHLAARHDALRTYFIETRGEVVQKIAPQVFIDVNMIDLSHLKEEELYNQREQIYAEESLIPFGLEKAPLLRVKIVKCREEEFDLIFTMHHLVSDGWSLEVLHREFYRYYKSIKEGRPFIPEPLKVQYKDYAFWHNQLLADREKLSEALEFWQHQLIEPPILELPYDFPPGDLTGKKSAAYRAVVDSNTTGKLKSLARDYQASVFMVLLASFNVLLWQLTGQEDILIGMPGAARQHEDVKNTIGLFVNTLVLRTPVDKNLTFENFLPAIQSNMIKMLEYQGYPLELLCEELAVKYPFISLFFNMVNTGDSSRERMPELETGHIGTVQEAKFHMALYLVEYRDGIDILCTYFTQLFLPETVERVVNNYIQLLQKIVEEPKKLLKEYRPTSKKLLRKVVGPGQKERN